MGYAAKRLLQHRPHVPEILAKGLLQDGVPVDNCEDVVTATDNVLAYIFTRGTNKHSKCCVVTEIFRKLAYRYSASTDPIWAKQGTAVTGALPSQLRKHAVTKTMASQHSRMCDQYGWKLSKI